MKRFIVLSILALFLHGCSSAVPSGVYLGISILSTVVDRYEKNVIDNRLDDLEEDDKFSLDKGD